MLEVEVALLDSFPPVVLAIVDHRMASSAETRWPELGQYAERLNVSREKLREWPRGDLVVFAESPPVFYDVVGEFLMTQVRLPHGMPVALVAFKRTNGMVVDLGSPFTQFAS